MTARSIFDKKMKEIKAHNKLYAKGLVTYERGKHVSFVSVTEAKDFAL